jgi:hypothetical protein
MPEKQHTAEENIHAKHVFNTEETIELSRELARVCTAVATLQAEKSAVTKDFASRIETNEIKSSLLVDKITSGYEMRPTDCIVQFDPKNRSKDYFRKDSLGLAGEFIERREMTQADFQLCLPTA